MKKLVFELLYCILFTSINLYAFEANTTSNTQEVAKQLQNPVASLISVPLQNNFEYGLGQDKKGSRYTLKIQPVIPTSMSENWNIIFRPIIPIVAQHSVLDHSSQSGLSDLQLQIFFSPKKVEEGNIIWGIGPVLLLPTATNNLLGSQKWGIGPSGVVLTQKGPWTMGLLANHILSFAGNQYRKNISLTYLQPFLAHSNTKGLSFNLSSETSYDWKDGNWTIPIIGGASQIVPIYGQLISFGLSGICYVKRPSFDPQWGIRANITFLFPNKN